MILFAGALLGFMAIAFGAYAEHGLRADVSDEAFRSVMTAIRYNQVHAVVVTAIGLALLQPAMARHAATGNAKLIRAAWFFIAGTALFSFTIYLSVAGGMPVLTRVTPLGGILLMAGWLVLAWAGLKSLAARDG